MINHKTNALLIESEDVKSLLSEWNNVPGWIKIHLSFKRPIHRFEGQLFLNDKVLNFFGRDMKDGRDYHLEILLESITEVNMGFNEDDGARIAFNLGITGFEPVCIHFIANGEDRQIYSYICKDNYQPHINFNTQNFCQTLGEMIAVKGKVQSLDLKHRVPVSL
jgi:hypothetical protein